MAAPQKNALANEFGFLRDEVVASTIDYIHLVNGGQKDGNNEIVAKLAFPRNISTPKQRGITETLLEVNSNSEFLLPHGSIIREWIFQDNTGGELDSQLAFMAGYHSDEITNTERKKVIATRVAGQNNQITGALLNAHQSVHIDQFLTSESAKQQAELYNAEAQEHGESPAQVSYTILSGNSYIGEMKALVPCVTITEGTLNIADISVYVVYTPPIHA